MKAALSLALLVAAAACAAAAPAPIAPFVVPYPYESTEPIVSNETNYYHLKGFPGLTAKYNADDSCPSATGKTIEEILALIGTPDFDSQDCSDYYRTNGGAGAYYNHALYFATIGPVGATPYETSASAELKAAITAAFGGYDELVQAVDTASATRWGPGFSWMCVMRETGDVMLTTTPLQDNPLMTNVAPMPCIPILAFDLYEHAYFLTYYSDRAQFVLDSFQIINWAKVSEYHALALEGTSPPVVNYMPVPPLPSPPPPSPVVTAPPCTVPNEGTGNAGCGNAGNDNKGDFNNGSNNVGSYNQGSGNKGDCNIGSNNVGNGWVGSGLGPGNGPNVDCRTAV